jgi:hypothetical protein
MAKERCKSCPPAMPSARTARLTCSAGRSHDLFEALAPDPTRRDALTWITSYAGIRHAPGVPLYDLMQAGKRGDDPRMFFSWYGGDFTTDPAFTELSPEGRADPSMASA